jgi:hypothetical protein
MANLGVFDWIRDGVRRSIILGVSDAFEQLGTPDDRNELHPQLAGALLEVAPRMIESSSEAAAIAAPTKGSGKTERRRLGRSLEQIRATADKLGKDAA